MRCKYTLPAMSVFLQLLLLFVSLSTSSALSLDLISYGSKGVEEGLVCNDGTPAGVYIRHPTSSMPTSSVTSSSANTHKWLVFLEGGGWCYDEPSCYRRIFKNDVDGPQLISSRSWTPTRSVGGLLEWLHYKHGFGIVFVPYCSSDAHMAEQKSLYLSDADAHVWFNGRNLALHALTFTDPCSPNQTIIFGGSSAGGRGAMMLINHVKQIAHPTTKVYGLIESALHVDVDPFSGGFLGFAEITRRAQRLFQPPLSQQCKVAFSEEDEWRCMFGEDAMRFVTVPSVITVFLYDSYQLDKHFDNVLPANWTLAMASFAEHVLRPRLASTTSSLMALGHNVLAPACYMHLMASQVLSNGLVIDHVALIRAMEALMTSHSLSLISSCSGLNCEASCPAVRMSVHARSFRSQ